jgi:ferredoxin--NADP+ reductase
MGGLPRQSSAISARLPTNPGTREVSERTPQSPTNGRLEQLTSTTLSMHDSRAMACGNPDPAFELRRYLSAQGFATSRRGVPGQLAFEKP